YSSRELSNLPLLPHRMYSEEALNPPRLGLAIGLFHTNVPCQVHPATCSASDTTGTCRQSENTSRCPPVTVTRRHSANTRDIHARNPRWSRLSPVKSPRLEATAA